ncbi:ras-related protein Rab-17-like isoform X1 [Nelusetta ayraudi]|uniref:ras-related protein Rab-17-like isoform X1 n=1 Tax=Nelusetta ayraudi TaxID=303726 RepID=UPI003F70A428
MENNQPGVSNGAQLQSPIRTLRVKLVLLGSSGVGKSSLALRFSNNDFRESATPTVGCAYLTQTVHLSQVSIRFEIWDTAGQEKYHSVTPLYYRGAHAALIVYDISNRQTFARAQLWLKELEKQSMPGSTIIWLVGNKGDLGNERHVSVKEGQTLADHRGLFFWETSALSGHHVSELLHDVAHRVYQSMAVQQDQLTEWEVKAPNGLHHRDTSNPLASCCRVGP